MTQATLSIKVQTGEIQTAVHQLKRLKEAGKQAEISTKRLSEAAQNQSVSFKRLIDSTKYTQDALVKLRVVLENTRASFTLLGISGDTLARSSEVLAVATERTAVSFAKLTAGQRAATQSSLALQSGLQKAIATFNIVGGAENRLIAVTKKLELAHEKATLAIENSRRNSELAATAFQSLSTAESRLSSVTERLSISFEKATLAVATMRERAALVANALTALGEAENRLVLITERLSHAQLTASLGYIAFGDRLKLAANSAIILAGEEARLAAVTERLSMAHQHATASLASFKHASDSASRSVNNYASSSKLAASSTSRLGSTLQRTAKFFAGFATIMSARAIANQADTWKMLNGRLRMVTDSEEDMIAVRQRLVDMSKINRGELKATGELYTRMSVGAKQLGISQEDLLDVTDSLQKSVKISGSFAAESAGAFRQFSQGINSGVLRGEELNSVLENIPRAAVAIAAGMGKKVGDLKKMGEDGELKATDVIKALLSQSEILKQEFEEMPITIGDSLIAVKNSMLQLVGAFDKVSGFSVVISSAFMGVAATVDFVKRHVNVFASIVGVVLVKHIMSSIAALKTLKISLLSTQAIAGAGSGFPIFARGLLAIRTGALSAARGMKLFTLSLLANPITIVVAAIAGLLVWLYKMRNVLHPIKGSVATLRDFWVTAFAVMKDGVIWLWEGTKAIYKKLKDGTIKAFKAISDFASKAWNNIIGFYTKVYTKMFDIIGKIQTAVLDSVKFIANKVTAILDIAKEGIVYAVDTVVIAIGGTLKKTLALGKAFGRSIAKAVKGDFKFTDLSDEMAKGMDLGLKARLKKYQDDVKDMLKKDYVGDMGKRIKDSLDALGITKSIEDITNKAKGMIGNVGKGLKDMGKGISEGLGNMGQAWVDKAEEEHRKQEEKKKKKAAAKTIAKAKKDSEIYKDIWRAAGSSMESTLSTTLSNTFKTGKLDFKSFATSIKNMWFDLVAKMIARWAMFKMFSGSAFGAKNILGLKDVMKSVPTMTGTSFFHAKGGVVNRATPIFHAQGGILNKPTSFQDTSGRNHVAGEAGAEAILPLAKASNGDLGVRMTKPKDSGGSNVTSNVTINVSVNSDSKEPEEQGNQIAAVIDSSISAKIDEKLINFFRTGGMGSRMKNT